MPSGLQAPPLDTPTAFLGTQTVGIRYEERVLCLPCSVTLDNRDLDLTLEHDEDHSQSCAACSSPI